MKTNEKIKELLVQELNLDIKPEDIADDMPLFGDEGLGLDSLDAVEIVVILKKHFDINIADTEQAKKIFTSVATLVAYIETESGKK